MIKKEKINTLRYTIDKNGNKWYVLSDFNYLLGFKSYDPKRFFKIASEGTIKKMCVGENKKGRWFCVSIKGIKEIMKGLSIKFKRKGTYSLEEKEVIARRYGWSYGFVEGHIYAGDLEKQIENAEKNHLQKQVKRYDVRGFQHQGICTVEN